MKQGKLRKTNRSMQELTSEGKRSRYRFLQKISPYVMVFPAMVFLLVFVFYPAVNMVYLSFFDYNLISEKTFIGLSNYRRLFLVNVDFINALKNTGIYTVVTLVLLIFFGLIFALWLQNDSKLNALAQRIMFLPHICAMLSIAMIFQWLMDDEGLFNAVLEFINITPLQWLNSSATSLISVIIVNLWKGSGYYALILLSSLKAIPPEIHEAAALDDAGPFQKFFKITLPMLSPQIFFLIVTITINSFKVFDSVRILTGGGPGDSSDVLVLYIYRYAFNNLQIGYASAAGTVLLVILLVLTLFYFRAMDRKVHYQ